MSDIEMLSQASTELANHVAAFVRLSNEFTGILADGDRDDIGQATRRVILRAAKSRHDEFRSQHFRGLIDSLNTLVNLVDRMYQAEPAAPEAPLPPAIPPDGDGLAIQLAGLEDGDATPVA